MTTQTTTPRPSATPLVPLSEDHVLALEAYADTILPGAKRHPDDEAVAGVAEGMGAVEAGAITTLTHPATGISEDVGGMADLLNSHAATFAAETGCEVRPGAEFASLPYARRRDLVVRLTSREEPTHDLWFLLALFAYMAYDSAPHRSTPDVIASGRGGLVEMGFAPPRADGRWVFSPAGYGRTLADVHPRTDEKGNLP